MYVYSIYMYIYRSSRGDKPVHGDLFPDGAHDADNDVHVDADTDVDNIVDSFIITVAYSVSVVFSTTVTVDIPVVVVVDFHAIRQLVVEYQLC